MPLIYPGEYDREVAVGDSGGSTTEVDGCVKKMIEVRKSALKNIKVAQSHQKRHYDEKHENNKQKYKIGTLVMIQNSKKLTRKGSKLEHNWSKPYKIAEILSKDTVKLVETDNSKALKQIYNVSRLKLYHERSDTKGCMCACTYNYIYVIRSTRLPSSSKGPT